MFLISPPAVVFSEYKVGQVYEVNLRGWGQHMNLVGIKPFFWVSDHVRHKPGYTATEDGWRLAILDSGNGGKTKVEINCMVTA